MSTPLRHFIRMLLAPNSLSPSRRLHESAHSWQMKTYFKTNPRFLNHTTEMPNLLVVFFFVTYLWANQLKRNICILRHCILETFLKNNISPYCYSSLEGLPLQDSTKWLTYIFKLPSYKCQVGHLKANYKKLFNSEHCNLHRLKTFKWDSFLL